MFRIIALLVVYACSALAGSFSFTGSFSQDDQLQDFVFGLNAPGTVTLRTLSYGGGTNEAAQLISAGGFDPMLSLFLTTGNQDLIALNNDGSCPPLSLDPATNGCFDSEISLFLPAGTYRLVLSQSDNSALGPFFSDGFLRTGQGNFTGPAFLGSNGSFIDITGAQRTGAWAVDLIGVDFAVAVPEPSTYVLLLSGIGAMAALRRRSANRSRP